MPLLKDILYKVPLLEVHGNTHIEVQEICIDSRKAQAGAAFVALQGTQVDGHNFIPKVLEQGCNIIIGEKSLDNLPNNTVFIQVQDSAKALGIIASNFYGNPSEHMKVVAVTGTNGKTTVATQLYNLHLAMGYSAGLLSTNKIAINQIDYPATHTTPDALSLQQNLKKMVDAGVEFCFMEASSHGIVQGRMAGIDLDGALFTNITHDHLDYHKTFGNYIAAKQKLFTDLPKKAFALYNLDDRNGSIMVQNSKASKYSYACKQVADYHSVLLENSLTGLTLKINQTEVHTLISGAFNAYNLTAVYAAAHLLGHDSQEVMQALSTLKPVEGRFDPIRHKEIFGIIDYAHTPDALENILTTLRQSKEETQKIITVFGCGGNRDAEKRPIMGKIAADLSDLAIITSDNPRNENPEEILRAIEAGIEIHQRKKTLTLSDRKEAIRAATRMAKPNDILLIAGKGHEKYQEILGIKHPFDDKQILIEFLNEL